MKNRIENHKTDHKNNQAQEKYLRRMTNEELSDMVGRSQDQFNDLRDMELSNTTIQMNETPNPFLGVLDDCIQELEISQNKIVGRIKEFSSPRKSMKTQPNFEKSFNSNDYDPFLHQEFNPYQGSRGTGGKERLKFLEKVDFIDDFDGFETRNERLYRTPDANSKDFLHEQSSNESFNLIPKIITSTKKHGKTSKRQRSFYRDSNVKVMMEENKQLRMLMSDYLREIDQLRYAYTKLRRKYSKVKDNNEAMEIEIKRISEINKLLKTGNSKKNQIFQNFCFCSNKPSLHKQKSFVGIMKNRKKKKIRSQESLHNIKVQLNSGNRSSFSPKNPTMNPSKLTSESRPLRSQIAKLIHRTTKPVKPRRTFDSLSFKDKLQWIKRNRNVGGSLNLKTSGGCDIELKNLEFFSKHNYGINNSKRRRNDLRSDNILSSFKKVKKGKQNFLRGKSKKLDNRRTEGVKYSSKDNLKIAIRNFENHTFGQEHFDKT